MPGAGELYVMSRNMPVLSLWDAVMDRKAITLPLPFIVDPQGTHSITDIRVTEAGAPDPGSTEFSVVDSGDGDRGWPFPAGIMTSHRSSASSAVKRPYLPAVSTAFFDVADAADANENSILHRARLAIAPCPIWTGRCWQG